MAFGTPANFLSTIRSVMRSSRRPHYALHNRRLSVCLSRTHRRQLDKAVSTTTSRVQNCLARAVGLLQDYTNSAASLLSQLHWLPIIKRIKFKIATLAYHSVAFCQRTILSVVLTPHQPQRPLRSLNQNLLSVPRCTAALDKEVFSTVLLKS